MRQFCFTILLLLCRGFLFSRAKVNDDYIEWSGKRRLNGKMKYWLNWRGWKNLRGSEKVRMVNFCLRLSQICYDAENRIVLTTTCLRQEGTKSITLNNWFSILIFFDSLHLITLIVSVACKPIANSLPIEQEQTFKTNSTICQRKKI